MKTPKKIPTSNSLTKFASLELHRPHVNATDEEMINENFNGLVQADEIEEVQAIIVCRKG